MRYTVLGNKGEVKGLNAHRVQADSVIDLPCVWIVAYAKYIQCGAIPGWRPM
jgi:hypothetical protein